MDDENKQGPFTVQLGWATHDREISTIFKIMHNTK